MIFNLSIIFLTLKLTSSLDDKNYLVNTETCKIPDYKPFNADTLPLFHTEKYKPCSKNPPLTVLKKNAEKATVYIDYEVAPLYGQNISCCFFNILRRAQGPNPDDDIVKTTPCQNFENSADLKAETVMIHCFDNDIIVFKEVYSPVQKLIKNTAENKKISVLFIVVDSVSRLNFIRTMPETKNYLLENNFIEMKGYNKIDENTFPNFMGFLTGFNMKQLKDANCLGRNINDLNNCPMIWYKFKDYGYSTAYAEDWSHLGTFNWNMKGFNEPPTTHYFRPYFIAAESLGIVDLHGAPYCAGYTTSGERTLNLAKDFSTTLKGDPYFGIFWMNTFSHQALNTPNSFDKIMRTFFTDLKADGVFDDSIVVFLSDHGMRTEYEIRQTIPGWFEERLPLNYISVPKWFQDKYKKEYENLKTNSKKLTSTFDLYMTLQHLLELSNSNYSVTASKACPNCSSFFNELPTRNCKEAGIPVEWCTCNGYLTPLHENEELVVNAVQYILSDIKNHLIRKKVNHLCEELSLVKVKSAGKSEYKDHEGLHYLFLNFITKPFADFTVTLRYKENENKILFNNIVRIYRFDWNSRGNCVRKFGANGDYCHCITPPTVIPNVSNDERMEVLKEKNVQT